MKRLYVDSYCSTAKDNLEELKNYKWPFDYGLLQKRIHVLEKLIEEGMDELNSIKDGS